MFTYFDLLPKDLIRMIEKYKLAANRNNLILHKFWQLFISKITYHYNREVQTSVRFLNSTIKRYNLKSRFEIGYMVSGGFYIDLNINTEEYISDEVIQKIITKYQNQIRHQIYMAVLNDKDVSEFNQYCKDRESEIKM